MDNLMQMRNYFDSGITKPYAFRKEQLIKLQQAVKKYEQPLHEALFVDLKKSPEECWVTETGFLLSELSNILKHLKGWMQPESVSTNLLNLPSKSFILQEPLGVVLIISPWNYPFQLLMTPLAGAMAAGNCVILKSSEFAPATSAVMKQMIEETFDKNYIQFVEGDGAVVIPEMMNNFTFDHVFYTGSTAVGKLVYKMAAERLVPVTLELGGKSPCVVEEDANIKIAAKRIAMTKFSNAGQMCVAPDYVLVHESRKEELIAGLKKSIHGFFGDKPEDSENYGKIINGKQFDRLVKYLQQGQLLHGGRNDKEKLFIEPTVISNVSLDADIMKDEIFGPILPVISFSSKAEALKIIAQNKNPLAFYVFTSSSAKEKDWLNSVAFGGGCINNASWHLTNHNLPFGGRGFSGSGQYHGKYSFETFSHKKAVMKTPTWFDPSIKYPPFKGKMKLFKMVIK
ncbi:MAG: aldehyde dehydrogenase [Chitinophagaceae bacterium]|nr:aldehyde dehydrogenase [Chitinophagaceae bacterium]MBL0198787.1 aldehyde dehydrogenase [Chitinophagaceae bacterium]